MRPETAPLVLAPGSAQGWFFGRAVVAWSPDSVAEGLTFREATEQLEHAFAAETPCLAVALLPYDGAASAACYSGGLVSSPEGWRVWGTLDAENVPTIDEPAPEPLARRVTLAANALSDMSDRDFRSGVRAIGEAIRAGDVYVLNLTRRLSGTPGAGTR